MATDREFDQFLARTRSDAEIAAALVDGFYLKRGVELAQANELAANIVAELREFERYMQQQPIRVHAPITDRNRRIIDQSVQEYTNAAKAAWLAQRLQREVRSLNR
jgi:hypothetical protein